MWKIDGAMKRRDEMRKKREGGRKGGMDGWEKKMKGWQIRRDNARRVSVSKDEIMQYTAYTRINIRYRCYLERSFSFFTESTLFASPPCNAASAPIILSSNCK